MCPKLQNNAFSMRESPRLIKKEEMHLKKTSGLYVQLLGQ